MNVIYGGDLIRINLAKVIEKRNMHINDYSDNDNEGN